MGNGDVWSSQAASLSFEMPSNDVAYVATFVTVGADEESIKLAVDGEEMRLAGDGSPYQVTLYAPPKPTAKPPFEGFCKTLAVRLTLDEQRVVTKAVIVDEILDDWLNSNPDEEDEEDFYGPS